ncbi:hypothetical protein H4582DRAFT_2031305 [Lactarius indigo]|nr:hypothetical protein H4582DRAFT_2031305 [Lactarius indigo]
MVHQSRYPVSPPSFGPPPSFSPPSVHLLSPLYGPPSGSTSHTIRKVSRGRRKEKRNVPIQGGSYRRPLTIGVLPDDVLLEIFDFCRKTLLYTNLPGWEWHLLVHVCQRWRQIVFASPHRLHLWILCTSGTPVRTNLGIWPPFPIVINGFSRGSITPADEDNVIAALEHPDRVRYLKLDAAGPQLERVVTTMQEPFPVLTHLQIFSKGGNTPALPGGLLGRSAPRLRTIYFHSILYPTLPVLLLSAGDLVTLRLHNIPPTGYISPEAMVGGLAALPKLERFIIEFQSVTSRPDRIRLPPATRIVLPALTSFEFKGASEYLEDLVARIDSPQLERSFVVYFNQLVDFQVEQLSQFIHRSVGPKLTDFKHARITFFSDKVSFAMYRHAEHPFSDRPLTSVISCEGIDWQASHVAQMFSELSATLSNMAHLELKVQLKGGRRLEGTEDVEWPHLLHQFSTVQTLRVSRELAGHAALALDDIAEEMATELLPSLDLIFLEGQPTPSAEKFVVVRQLSGRPIAVVYTETEFSRRLRSYIAK